MHAALERAWQAMDRALHAPPDPLWRMTFATAVGEIAANVLTHALAGAPTGSRAELGLRLLPDRLVATFRDRGAPYATPQAPAPETDDLAESGRGIDLARAALDDLSYTRSPAGENVWTLTKRFPRE